MVEPRGCFFCVDMWGPRAIVAASLTLWRMEKRCQCGNVAMDTLTSLLRRDPGCWRFRDSQRPAYLCGGASCAPYA
jgi:hypothetical protein